MKIFDPLPNWGEPRQYQKWGANWDPPIKRAWLAHIAQNMRPDEIVAVGRLLLPTFVEYKTGVSQPVRGDRFPSEHTGISGAPLTIACAYVL